MSHCYMIDGGDECVEYTELWTAWDTLRKENSELLSALGKIAAERARFDGDAWFLRDIARIALKTAQEKS